MNTIKKLFSNRWKTVPEPDLEPTIMAPPKTLKELGYDFNSDGCLRQLDANGVITDKAFQFNISDNHQKCQQHYEEIGDAVSEYVYKLLENEMNLIKHPVPKESNEKTGTFVYVSKNFNTASKLMVLMHGSGVVRAGQWARSLIMNGCLEEGSQLPYIRNAIQKNFAILLMNLNDNHRIIGGKSVSIKGSATAKQHAEYVWKNYISPAKATDIVIVAHSFGGVVVMELAKKFPEDFQTRVKGIALTDSVHPYSDGDVPRYVVNKSLNWVSSSKPLDSTCSTPPHDLPRVSAGHEKHEMTSYCAMDSVFNFLIEKVSK